VRRFTRFLSYSHAEPDRSIAVRLHRRLENYSLPRDLALELRRPRRLGSFFRDDDELRSSSDLGAEIRQALGHSDRLIVLCSPSSRASRWVNLEIETFLESHPIEQVACLLLEGDPEHAIPSAMLTALDGREPFAPDFRESERSRRDCELRSFLKLVAAIVGCAFDDLFQRDRRAALRRAQLRTAVAVPAAVIFAGLALYAVDRESAARKNERRAVDARMSAEDLSTFMLNDLSDRLDRIGQRALLSSVATKLQEYYARPPAPDDDPRSSDNRIKVLFQLAHLAMGRGESSAAESLAREALQNFRATRPNEEVATGEPNETSIVGFLISCAAERVDFAAARQLGSEAVRKAANRVYPDPIRRAHDLAFLYLTMVQVESQAGDLEAALTAYRLGKANLGPLVDLPNPEWNDVRNDAKFDASIAYALRHANRPSEALKHFEASLAKLQRARTLAPDAADLTGDIGIEYLNTAWTHEQVGDLTAAKVDLARAVQAFEETLARVPGAFTAAYNLVKARETDCRFARMEGDHERALASAHTTIRIARDLLAQHPDHARIKPLLAGALCTRAGIEVEQRLFLEARADVDEGLALFSGSLADVANSRSELTTLVGLRGLRGKVMLETDAAAGAAELTQLADEFRPLALRGDAAVDLMQAFADVLQTLAGLRLRARQVDAAEAAYGEALGVIEQVLTRGGPPEEELVRDRIQVEWGLGHCHLDRGDGERAVAAYSRALDRAREGSAMFPRSEPMLRMSASAAGHLAGELLNSDPERVIALCTEARELIRSVRGPASTNLSFVGTWNRLTAILAIARAKSAGTTFMAGRVAEGLRGAREGLDERARVRQRPDGGERDVIENIDMIRTMAGQMIDQTQESVDPTVRFLHARLLVALDRLPEAGLAFLGSSTELAALRDPRALLDVALANASLLGGDEADAASREAVLRAVERATGAARVWLELARPRLSEDGEPALRAEFEDLEQALDGFRVRPELDPVRGEERFAAAFDRLEGVVPKQVREAGSGAGR
jgi:tetratricopeptide (TPR) repeat protein